MSEWQPQAVPLSDYEEALRESPIAQFDDLVRGWNEIYRRWDAIARRYPAVVVTLDPDHTIDRHEDRYAAIAADYMAAMSPDAHSVRFSEMSAEAEAELAAWDEMLHGKMEK